MVSRNFTVFASDDAYVKANKVLLSRLNDVFRHSNFEISNFEGPDADSEYTWFTIEYPALNSSIAFAKKERILNPLDFPRYIEQLFLMLKRPNDGEMQAELIRDYSAVAEFLPRFIDEYYFGYGWIEDIACLGDVDALNRRLQTEFPMNYAA